VRLTRAAEFPIVVLRTTSVWLASGRAFRARRLPGRRSSFGGRFGARRPIGFARAGSTAGSPTAGSEPMRDQHALWWHFRDGNGGAAATKSASSHVEGCADSMVTELPTARRRKPRMPNSITERRRLDRFATNGASFVTTSELGPSNAWGSDASGSANGRRQTVTSMGLAACGNSSACSWRRRNSSSFTRTCCRRGQIRQVLPRSTSPLDTVGCTGAATSQLFHAGPLKMRRRALGSRCTRAWSAALPRNQA